MDILIIEDDLIMTLLLTRMLKSFNYHVTSAKDGREGIDMINRYSYDLVITDLMLPFASGPQIVSHLKKVTGKKTPVILLSSMPVSALEIDNNNVKADSYLTKPVYPEELRNTIEALTEVECF